LSTDHHHAAVQQRPQVLLGEQGRGLARDLHLDLPQHARLDLGDVERRTDAVPVQVDVRGAAREPCGDIVADLHVATHAPGPTLKG
jgi:hypothetical protein